MENQSIVRELAKKGVMVTPQVLETIKNTGFESFLKNVSQETSVVVQGTTKTAQKISCRVGSFPVRDKITPDDVIKQQTQRYEKLRDILLRKIEAVSINKTERQSGKVSVVGIVGESRNGMFTLEDPTGSIEVRYDKFTPDSDDVIGVSGWVRNGIISAEDLLYPDIPINREAATLDGQIVLTDGKDFDCGAADVVITPDTLNSGSKEKMIPNPGWVFLEREGKKATVLIYTSRGSVDRKVATAWLRKRFVGGEACVTGPQNILSTIPDIVWIISEGSPWTENYKGVTMISFGKGHHARINMNTRKVELG